MRSEQYAKLKILHIRLGGKTVNKYRLVKSTDLKGKPNGVLEYITMNHSCIGTIPYLNMLEAGSALEFVYDNDSGLCMRTSWLKEITRSDKEVKAVTKNSIYYFEKVERGDD